MQMFIVININLINPYFHTSRINLNHNNLYLSPLLIPPYFTLKVSKRLQAYNQQQHEYQFKESNQFCSTHCPNKKSDSILWYRTVPWNFFPSLFLLTSYIL